MGKCSKEVCHVWIANSNILTQKSGKSGCRTRVRQTIVPTVRTMYVHCFPTTVVNGKLATPFTNTHIWGASTD